MLVVSPLVLGAPLPEDLDEWLDWQLLLAVLVVAPLVLVPKVLLLVLGQLGRRFHAVVRWHLAPLLLPSLRVLIWLKVTPGVPKRVVPLL